MAAEEHPTIPPSDHPPSAPHPALPGDPPHMRRDWKPPLTERSLDAALWYGQTGERVGRRAEKKVDQLAPIVAELSDALSRLVRAIKWVALLAGGVWVVDTARRVGEWVSSLHH